MKKILLFCLVALVQAAQAFAAQGLDIAGQSTLLQAAGKGKLVVGMEEKFWPFEYTNEKGEAQGFDVDLARLIAKEMGVVLEIKDMEWTGLIPALQTGKIDLIISGMTGTLERAKSITFSAPYFETGLCALLSVAKAKGVNKIEELNEAGRIVAVKTGSTADIVAAKRFPKAEIRRYKDETACVSDVVNGRADGFFYDQISIAKHHKQNPETTRAILTPFTYEPFCIGMRKGDFDLWQWIEMFLKLKTASGELEELKRKHLSDVTGN